MRASLKLSNFIVAVAVAIFATGNSRASSELPPLQVVESVDLERYLGTWYEIASIPQRFQEGCVSTKAEYAKTKWDSISVTNSCEVDGKLKRVRGKAWVVDTETNAKLKVQFFWPFKGDYWIIELDENYQYAVVGGPKRTALWILSRTPKISDELYNDLMNRVEFKHRYNPRLVNRAP